MHLFADIIYRFAVRCVPVIVARHPRQVAGERSDEKPQTPRNDDVVEEVHVERNQHNGVSDSWGDDGGAFGLNVQIN